MVYFLSLSRSPRHTGWSWRVLASLLLGAGSLHAHKVLRQGLSFKGEPHHSCDLSISDVLEAFSPQS